MTLVTEILPSDIDICLIMLLKKALKQTKTNSFISDFNSKLTENWSSSNWV